MFGDKSPDIEAADCESNERLLAEEAQLWTRDEETDTCNAFATRLLQMTAVGLFFLVGTLFGFLWRGDLDSQCSRHVSQYCEQISFPSLLWNKQLTNEFPSSGDERSGNQIQSSGIQRIPTEGKHLSTGCKSGGGCGLGFLRCELYVYHHAQGYLYIG